MKQFLLFQFSIFAVTLCDVDVHEHWMTMPLNHFDLFDNRTWEMRYLVKQTFFQKGNPLFLKVGGESLINEKGLLHWQLHILAKQHEGMMVYPEHRYYGKSLPFSTDFSTENLQYLQIEQVLDDLAYFIEAFKKQTKGLENSLVVIHGCSYPGMLATLMRLKFPHLVDIAYASSPPLGVSLEYPEFFEIAHDVYANVSEHCMEIIKKGFNTTANLLTTQKGIERVRNALQGWQCGDVGNMSSVEILRLMTRAMDLLNNPHNYEKKTCSALSMGKDYSSAFEHLAKVILVRTRDLSICGNASEHTNEHQKQLDKEFEQQYRDRVAFTYQTCTELGSFPTLDINNSKNIFAVDMPLDELLEVCVVLFGENFTKEVLRRGTERVTRRYGGKEPVVTKVVTVQGTDDPWKHRSSLKNYSSEAPVFVVKGNQCVDLSEDNNLPEEIVQVQEKVLEIITGWIDELNKKK